MLITTTSHVEGRPIQDIKGLVVGHAVVAVDIFEGKDVEIAKGVKRVGAYERTFTFARNAAMAELLADAKSKGANAIVDLHLQFGEVDPTSDASIFASFTGTAVVV
ncbi:MAG: heavy metal-binding domain-containing protein [Planctomycetes bacterium]|nr:heavy metal-binding domain-containing protein [Planctomycetota bacterium]